MSCCLGSTPFYFWKHLHVVRHIEFKNAFPTIRSRERKFEQPLARGLFWSRLFFILFAFETVWEVLLFQTVGRMIVPDKIFKDRTCLVFCFLGCVVKFQAREANSCSRPRSASSNPGNRVCERLLFLSFFSFLCLFLPTFSIFSLYLYLY